MSLESIGSIKVSIIMPTYNSSKYIGQSIRSVQSQTHQNWELLISDDCSTDNSEEIVSSFSTRDSRIKYTRLDSNTGPGRARNTSIKASSGDVIAFLDSDDLWDTDFLEKSLLFMETNQASIVYSSYRRKSESLKEDLGEFIVPNQTDYKNMLKSCVISCLTGMYNIQRCDGKTYMPNIRKRQDYCVWLSLLKHVDKAYGIKEVMATYRIRQDSVSRNKFKTAQYQWYVYRNIEKLSIPTSLYYFAHYAIKGFLKNYTLFRVRE